MPSRKKGMCYIKIVTDPVRPEERALRVSRRMNVKVIVLSCLLCLPHCLFALTIGADNAPSRQPFVTFPTGAVSNIILGYAAMDGGFALADSLTSVSFNSYFPVNSTMILSDGVVQLAMNLNLTSSCDLPTTGTINGNGYTVAWAPHIGTLSLPSTIGLPGALYFINANVTFNASVFLQAPLYFYGGCTLDGNGYSLDLGTTGSIIVASSSSLSVKNVRILNLNGTNLVCTDTTGLISFDQVSCQLSGDYSFSQGALAIIGDTLFTGTYKFTYRTTQMSTIYGGAMWYFDSGMTFSYDPSNSAANLLNFQNSEAILYFYETSLYAPSTGLQLTKGTWTFDGICPVYSTGVTMMNGIVLGDGVTTASSMSLNILPETSLNITSGYLVNNNVN